MAKCEISVPALVSRPELRTCPGTSRGALAEMEKLVEPNLLIEKIDGKSIILSRRDLTRALETIWELFFDHFDLRAGARLAT